MKRCQVLAETVGAGMHVGEIGLLEPFNGRSATVVAIDTVVVAQLSGQKFTDIAKFHPKLWHRIAMENGQAIRQSGESFM